MSLSFPKTVKYLLFIAMLICFKVGSAQQKYDNLSARIDSLANIGLPKSALKEVDKLDALAHADNNAAQQVRAVIYRMTFQSYIEEDALVGIITRLQADINKAGFPVKPVLQSLLAQMYWQYYQQNRYRYGQRTKQDGKDIDFRKWDLQTIIDEANRLYALSLQEAVKEQATPVGVLDGVLEGDKETRYLRPTLYDLLVHRAFDFYLSDEAAINKPRLPFTLTDVRLFGDSRTFSGLDIKTTDTLSTLYKGFKYLQQATLFHLEKNDREALADIDIKRLTVLLSQSTVAGKDSLYINALQQVANSFSDKPISAEALDLIGKYFNDQDSLFTAHSYFKKAATLYPQSHGGKTAAHDLSDIEKQQLSAETEDVNVPGKPLLGLISYANITNIKIAVYRLTAAQLKSLGGKEVWDNVTDVYPYDNAIKQLKQMRPLQEQLLDLPGTKDYRRHSAEFKIDALPIGDYIIVASDAKANNNRMTAISGFKITHLAYTTRANPGGKTELRIVDRDSGAPLPGVKITLSKDNYSANKFTKIVVETGFSDANGKYLFDVKKNEEYYVKLTKGDDSYSDANSEYTPPEIEAAQSSHSQVSAIFYTDRQLYRPGQTIYFKGLIIDFVNSKNAIIPGEIEEVNLRDMNDKIISGLSLKTNEFGSVQGSFIVPQNITAGSLSIGTTKGRVYVRVEEYKRPTFRVSFLPVTATYRFGDSVRVKGKVTAFSGYGISNARVAYHINLQPVLVPGEGIIRNNVGSVWINNREIKIDTIITNNRGEFEIACKANMGDTIAYVSSLNYYITADVTDASGETQTAATSVAVSKYPLSINAALPQKLAVTDNGLIPVRLDNPNRQPQKGTITLKIYNIKQPLQYGKNRVWQKADQYVLTGADFKKAFPAYVWKNDDDAYKMPVLNTISETTINIDSTAGKLDLSVLKKQPAGLYKISLFARSAKGDTSSFNQIIEVLPAATPAVKLDDWAPVITNVKAGTQVAYLVGLNRPSHVLMETYDGAKLLSSKWIALNSTFQQTVKIDVPATTDDRFAVQFLTVSDNRMYHFYSKIKIIDTAKKLDLRFIAYRDKLQPGEKEQWKLQVTGVDEKHAAEMLATLYDASLDEISPAQYWRTDYNNYDYNGRDYFRWIDKEFATESDVRTTEAQNETADLPDEVLYEHLNLFGYNYFGGGNDGYNEYLERVKQYLADRKQDKKLAAGYFRNARLVKNGYDISGTVSVYGQLLKGARISIKNTAISTSSNSKGYFKIKVPKNGVLVFLYPPFYGREIKTKTAANLSVEMWRRHRDGTFEELKPARPGTKSLKGDKNADTIFDETVGNSDVKVVADAAARFPAPIVKPDKEANLSGYFNKESVSGNVMMREIRTKPGVKYGRDILRKLPGIQVIDDYGDQSNMGHPIIPRKNFNETAFFYPQLHTDEKGQILIDFTIPEALTRWKFRGFAHTKDLVTGYIENEVITQKQLSVSAKMPRFLREGDTIAVSARLANLADKTLKGTVKLQLFNALNMQPVNLFVSNANAEQNFTVDANSNKAITFHLVIPAELDALTYRLTADAGQFTDGEENTLPVLPNRILVTESMPMMVRAGQSHSFTFDKLLNQTSKTLQNEILTLEYTQNPAWYAVQALPYMMEFPYECSEQTFSRYYANSLAANLVNKLPAIKQVFDQWKAANSVELLSNLEKNQELKSTLIEETPWLKDAVSETEQKKRIALLFDLNKMSDGLRANLEKLQKKQLPDGGFPWFGGNRSDRYITQHILQGIGELYHLNIKDETLGTIVSPALNYMDKLLIEDDKAARKLKDYATRPLNAIEIQAWFARSFFTDKQMDEATGKVQALYLKRAADQWTTQNVYKQAMIALTMQRYKVPALTQQIEKSLLETAQQSDDMGMYWAKNQRGYFWYESPVETQSLLIELFTEAGNNAKAIEEMKIWLLRNKQANNWKTTTATAAACYALLLKGDNILARTGASEIKLNGKPLEDIKPEVKADAGTGYIKTSWIDEQVKPSLGKIDIKNNGTNLSWGAMHWQYLEDMDKITSAQSNIRLSRKYFIQKQTDAGPALVTVDATHQPKTGDLLKVVINLEADRDFEYVQLKDLRPAGTEPVEALSDYKYQDGLYYYQVSKDVATNFFISYLNKGSYVFEYRLRVAQPGNFSTGITSAQSMYAPEFNAHSGGSRIGIRP